MSLIYQVISTITFVLGLIRCLNGDSVGGLLYLNLGWSISIMSRLEES